MKLFVIIIINLLLISCSESNTNPDLADTKTESIKMIELGADDCIPCQKMQPVLKSLDERYGDNLIVEFIDVYKEYEKAAPYNIKAMPTQVFLNDAGQEIHRHIGFYPEDEIDEFLQGYNIYPLNN